MTSSPPKKPSSSADSETKAETDEQPAVAPEKALDRLIELDRDAW